MMANRYDMVFISLSRYLLPLENVCAWIEIAEAFFAELSMLSE
jgi:hypothetical protein